MMRAISEDCLTFQTPRLVVKPMTLEEQQCIHYHASSATNASIPLGGHYLIQDTVEYITDMLKNDKQVYLWGIYLQPNNTLIGSIHLSNVSQIHRHAQISFLLAEDYWGQGFSTEAVACVIDFVFDKLGLNKLLAKCFIEHYPTHRVLQKLNMDIEGISKRHFYLNGIFHDVTLYAKFNESSF